MRWDSEKLEKEQAKTKLERETARLTEKTEAIKNRLTADLTAKEAEIERVKTAWQEKYNRSEVRRKEAEEGERKIREEWAEEDSEIEELRAKNETLKREKAKLENKKTELDETIKALQPSYAYQLAEKFGIIKLKNLAVNACVAIVLIGGLYVISLVLKYLVKPTYKNVKSVFGSRKKTPLIAEEVEEEEEEEEEEEDVFEVEPKRL